MISLLLPTRGRPDNVKRLADSISETTSDHDDIELVVVRDYDDNADDNEYPYADGIRYIFCSRMIMSKYWNLAYAQAKGPIYMQCADDVVFRTEGWDGKVHEAFDKHQDEIVFVYGDDGDPNKDKNYGTHGFIHKNWVEAVGYFVPPYFSSDFSDTWLNEVADGIGRKLKIDILTEHMHPAFGKAELDLTYAERLVRHWKDDMPGLYASKADERLADMEKLRKVMSV